MTSETPHTWSRRKKDNAPRGVWRHPSGQWAIRFTCGAGHVHKEQIGALKTAAIGAYQAARTRARSEPSWCPAAERAAARSRAATRLRVADVLSRFQAWRREHRPRSQKADKGLGPAWATALGDRWLDEVAPRDVARVLEAVGAKRTPATRNRYRAYASALFTWAVREGYVATNPARAVPSVREKNQRLAFLTDEAEAALADALAPALRPHFAVSVHTGLRWSEQMGLRWRDVDFLTGFLTIPRSKHGAARRVPMNAVVRGVLLELATRRTRPDDPDALVFPPPGRPDVFFVPAARRAREALEAAGRHDDAARLEGYTWHGNRHTFASRLVMAGVDLRTVQELGGWKTAAMVVRYAHLSPGHLQEAIERLVPGAPMPASGPAAPVELSRNYPATVEQAPEGVR